MKYARNLLADSGKLKLRNVKT